MISKLSLRRISFYHQNGIFYKSRTGYLQDIPTSCASFTPSCVVSWISLGYPRNISWTCRDILRISQRTYRIPENCPQDILDILAISQEYTNSRLLRYIFITKMGFFLNPARHILRVSKYLVKVYGHPVGYPGYPRDISGISKFPSRGIRFYLWNGIVSKFRKGYHQDIPTSCESLPLSCEVSWIS